MRTAPSTIATGASGRALSARTRLSRTGAVTAVVCGLLLLFGVVAARGSLWEARLSAPQYPEGLRAAITVSGAIGDLQEIDVLNHYVGVSPLEGMDMPELVLWVPSVIAAILLGIAALLLRRWWLRWPALLGMWSVPAGVIAMAQFRLYQLGHDLDPAAALVTKPFTPLVLGPTRVANFSIWGLPGTGLTALLAAAVLVTVAFVVVGRWRRSRR